LKQEQLCEILFMFVSKQIISLDRATLVFELNGIIKKIN